MKVEKSKLARALKSLGRIADGKSPLPVLRCVLGHAEGNVLRLVATDMKVALALELEAVVPAPMSFVVSAKDLAARVELAPGDDVTFALKGDTLHLSSGSRKYALGSASVEDFPKLPVMPGASVLEVDGNVFRELIRKTSFAIAENASRPALACSLVEFGDGMARMVTTDGHRLSMAELDAPGALTMMLPEKAVFEVRKLLDGQRSIEVERVGADGFFRVPGAVLSVRLGDEATFPPYRQVLPSQSACHAKVVRDELAQAVRGVAVAEAVGSSVKFGFAPGSLSLSAQSPATGEATDAVEIKYQGEAVTIGLHAEYVLDVLTALSDETVGIEFSGVLDPVSIRAPGYHGVVMPMRV